MNQKIHNLGNVIARPVVYVVIAFAVIVFTKNILLSKGALLGCFMTTPWNLMMNIMESPTIVMASILFFLLGYAYLSLQFIWRCAVCISEVIVYLFIIIFIGHQDRKMVFREVFSTLFCWDNIWIILLPVALTGMTINFVGGYIFCGVVGLYAALRVVICLIRLLDGRRVQRPAPVIDENSVVPKTSKREEI